ncbi:hypothetical protein LCGC14_1564320 [marine sediment metagenome]|uniref:ATP-dependent DNA ligase family profile domain-containing protein n=1 Tax=marine sediment metagenome TaxID=412755 RepID=A0A0F9J7P9_9ZZZZ
MSHWVYGVDSSFDELTLAEARKLVVAGVQVYAQCLWTGREQPASRISSLRNAMLAGIPKLVGYISVSNNGQDGAWHVNQARAGVPDDIWRALAKVPADVEIPGLTMQTHVVPGLNRVVALGKPRDIYTDWNTGEEYTMATIGEFIKQARAAGYQGIGTGILDERFFEPGSDKVDRWLKFVKDMQSFQVEITGGLPDSQDLFRVDRDPSGGPGGGARGPVYQAPDRDAVEEFLQTFQVATTGQLEQGLLDQAVDSYLTTHRQDFDDKNQRHDPQVAAYNVIRNSTSYKDIHELRPESENEMQWVTGQQARLRMVGLNSEESQRLGIQLARVGANAEANKDAANQAFLGTTGRVAKDQRNSLKKSASAVLGLL